MSPPSGDAQPPSARSSGSYEQLVAEALAAPVQGWDFAWLAGRAVGSEPSWSYTDEVVALLPRAGRVLDIDTGGGEQLAQLHAICPLPAATTATEGWAPNLPVATGRLAPLGVQVLPAPDPHLPVPDASADLVLDRHGRLVADEVARVLAPGGHLVTEQVGSEDCADLNSSLGAPPAHALGSWTAQVAQQALTGAGLRVHVVREEWPALAFLDIGALVFHLRVVPWQVPDFSIERYDTALRAIDQRVRSEGGFRVRAHRFLLIADRVTTRRG